MADSLIYSLISVCEHISLYRTIDSQLNSNSSIVFLFFKGKINKTGIFWNQYICSEQDPIALSN